MIANSNICIFTSLCCLPTYRNFYMIAWYSPSNTLWCFGFYLNVNTEQAISHWFLAIYSVCGGKSCPNCTSKINNAIAIVQKHNKWTNTGRRRRYKTRTKTRTQVPSVFIKIHNNMLYCPAKPEQVKLGECCK